MNLPELPVPVNFHSAIYVGPSTGYTADQMRAYAEQAVKTLEADAADAKRYRWLRDQHEGPDGAETFCVFAPDYEADCLQPVGSMPGELDAAIDAAIGRQGSGKP